MNREIGQEALDEMQVEELQGMENRKNPDEIASETLKTIFALCPDGVSLADIKEIFSNIEERFASLKIQLSDT